MVYLQKTETQCLLPDLFAQEGESAETRMQQRQEQKVLDLTKHIGRATFRYVLACRETQTEQGMQVLYSIYVEHIADGCHTLGCLCEYSADMAKSASYCRTLSRNLATPLSMEEFYL